MVIHLVLFAFLCLCGYVQNIMGLTIHYLFLQGEGYEGKPSTMSVEKSTVRKTS